MTVTQRKKAVAVSTAIKVGTNILTTRNETFNGINVLKGELGVVVNIPKHRTDMVLVEFKKITTLFPTASLKRI